MKRLIKKKASQNKLEFELVAAIIWQESKGNPWVHRVEEGFFKRYIEGVPASKLPGYFPDFPPTQITERWDRSSSWGLMQLMGNTARLIGYKKRDLTRLCVPAINLEFGCRYLRSLIDAAPGSNYHDKVMAALLRWNGGGDKEYPDKIWAHIVSGEFNRMFE